MAYETRYPYNNVESAKSPEKIEAWKKNRAAFQGIFDTYMDTVLAAAGKGYEELQAKPDGPEKTADLQRFGQSMKLLLRHFKEFAGTENLDSRDGSGIGYYTPSRLHARITGTEGLLQGLNIPAADLDPALPGDTDVAHQNISQFIGNPPYLNIINNTLAKLEGASPTKQLVLDVPGTEEELYRRMQEAKVKPLIMPQDPGIPKPWQEAWQRKIADLKQFGNSSPESLREMETLLATQKPYQELERGVPVAPVNAELITERLGMLDVEDVMRRCASLRDNPGEFAKIKEIQKLAAELYNVKDPSRRFDPNNADDMNRMAGAEFSKLQTDEYKKEWLTDDPQFLAKAERLQELVGGSKAMYEYLGFMVVVTNPNTPEVNIAMVPPDVLTQSVGAVVQKAYDQQPRIDMPVPPAIAALMGVVPNTPDEMEAFVKSLERRKERGDQPTLELPAGMQRPPREPEEPSQMAALAPVSGPVVGVLRGDDPKQALTFLAYADTDGHPELEPMKALAQQTLGMLKDSSDISKLPAALANKAFQEPFKQNMAELQQLIADNKAALDGLTPSVMLPEGEGRKLGDMLSEAAEKGMALGEGKRADLKPEERHAAWQQATADVRRQIGAGGNRLVMAASMQPPEPPGIVVADNNTPEAAITR